MRIAINAMGCKEADGILNMLQAWAVQKKEHAFIAFSDNSLSSLSNINVEVIGSPVNSLLAKRWWLDVKLPAALKKFRADVLVNINGDASLRARLPQLLYIGNTLFLDAPKQLSSAEALFVKFYLPKYLRKVNALVVPSGYAKQTFEDQFDIAAEKISVIQNIANDAYRELEWDEKEQVKETNTDGKEYFLYNVNELGNDILTVLKAFSQFKKWQRSNMKLIVLGDLQNEITEKINTYKFRDDIIVLNNNSPEQKAKLMAAAYAFIYMPPYYASQPVLIAAMRSGIPVITSDMAVIKEVCGESVLYADPSNADMIAAQIIKLHKDETLRSKLIEEGKLQATEYPDDSSAERLWQLIQSTAAGSAE